MNYTLTTQLNMLSYFVFVCVCRGRLYTCISHWRTHHVVSKTCSQETRM